MLRDEIVSGRLFGNRRKKNEHMWVMRKNENLSDHSIKSYESNCTAEEEKQKESKTITDTERKIFVKFDSWN